MNLDKSLARALDMRGDACDICQRPQLRPPAYVELRRLVTNGQFTQADMDAACVGYCLGHVGEWHPDFIINEERQP